MREYYVIDTNIMIICEKQQNTRFQAVFRRQWSHVRAQTISAKLYAISPEKYAIPSPSSSIRLAFP